jgi:hypothetical protein
MRDYMDDYTARHGDAFAADEWDHVFSINHAQPAFDLIESGAKTEAEGLTIADLWYGDLSR